MTFRSVGRGPMFRAVCFSLVPCNQNRKAHATDCRLQLEELLFHRETCRLGSVSRRGSDIRVTGRAYAATRQSKNCEVLIRSATSLLQSELRVFAGVDRLQFVGVGT